LLKNTTATNWLILIVLSIVWGSSFILMKKALDVFSNIQVASLRIGISFLIFLPLALKNFSKIPKKKLLPILGVGLAGSFVPAFLYTTAQTQIDSAAAGILNSLTPLWTFVIGIIFFNQNKNWMRALGVFIGLIGALFLVLLSGEKLSFNLYALLIVLATALYGLSGNLTHFYLKNIKATTLTAVSFFFIGVPALIILFTTDFIPVMQAGGDAWLAFVYTAVLAIGGTALALLLYWKLVQNTDALFGSIVTYLIPIVAIFWGLLDGEVLRPLDYLGFGLLILSIFLLGKRNKANTPLRE